MAASSIGKMVSSVFRPGIFKNRVALVTGGGSGIGKGITQELLYLGCNVMIASRKQERLEETANELREGLKDSEQGPRVEYMTCNIRNDEDVEQLLSKTVKKFGKLDFLVNNGGGQFLSLAEDIKPKGWDAVIETNLTGTFFMCQAAYNQWMKDHGGAIVNIVADMWKGFPMMSHTGAARAGVDNLTKSLAIEWAHSGVRVNSVAPGIVYSDTAAANYADPEIFNKVKDMIPFHRLGTVEEISSAVCFLLSPGARYITGETVKVDAGLSLYSCATYKVPEHTSIPAYTWSDDITGDKETGSDGEDLKS